MQLVEQNQDIKNKIYTIRGLQVMLDRDLAELYGVQTKVFNQAVKRNIARFPDDFMFQLSKEEFENWKSQIVTSNSDKMGLRKSPFVFTEQGISMLSAILKSTIAVDMSLRIIRAFVNMRKLIANNSSLFQQIQNVQQRLISYEIKTDKKIDTILNAIEDKEIKPKQGIFYDGQVFDAYRFIADLIRSSTESITLIDNYIDDTTLTLFSKNQDIDVIIYTQNISKQLKLDLEKYNSQYKRITIKPFKDSHDRFMIIDNKEVYHIGSSLKDLGKKWFAFSKFNIDSFGLLERLKNV
jgi:hypothetical protein